MVDITIAEKLVRNKSDLDTIDKEVKLQGGIIAQIQEALSTKGAGKSYDTDIINRSISGNYTNENLDTIGAYAFYGCSGLTSITFPKCKSIDSFAFSRCENLLTGSFAVCDVSNYAFENCTKLQEILFNGYGSSSSFADQVFYGCSSLHTVILTNDKPVSIGQGLGDLVAGGTCFLYVPSALILDYSSNMYGSGVLSLEDLPETSVFYGSLAASRVTELSSGDESTPLE
jgi:hypothetical protein